MTLRKVHFNENEEVEEKGEGGEIEVARQTKYKTRGNWKQANIGDDELRRHLRSMLVCLF